MTPCTGNPADLYLERYLQGSLPEFEAQQFEEHYFDCPVCLAQVQALGAVAARLETHPEAAPPAVISRRLLSWPVRLVALGAIAALVVFGVLGFHVYQAGRRPSMAQKAGVAPAPASVQTIPAPAATPAAVPDLTSLADLSLPPFRAPLLRGADTASGFADGMAAYARSDCRGAVKSLSQISQQDENKLAAEFYSGVCEMELGNMATATKQLEQVASAGDSPQQEAALYYLAQVSLASRNTESARRYLARTIALHGDFERRARAEQDKLH
jgi:hypothetical protein